jgi:hypothetical protein
MRSKSGKPFVSEKVSPTKIILLSTLAVTVENDFLRVAKSEFSVRNFGDVFVVERLRDIGFQFADVVLHFFHFPAQNGGLRFLFVIVKPQNNQTDHTTDRENQQKKANKHILRQKFHTIYLLFFLQYNIFSEFPADIPHTQTPCTAAQQLCGTACRMPVQKSGRLS